MFHCDFLSYSLATNDARQGGVCFHSSNRLRMAAARLGCGAASITLACAAYSCADKVTIGRAAGQSSDRLAAGDWPVCLFCHVQPLSVGLRNKSSTPVAPGAGCSLAP